MKTTIRLRNVTVPFIRNPLFSVLDGKLYVIGGDDIKGHVSPSNRVYVLDIASNTWDVHHMISQITITGTNAVAVSGGGAITVFVEGTTININDGEVSIADIDLPNGITKSNACFVENIGIVVVMGDQSFIIDYSNDIVGMPPPLIPTVGHSVCALGGMVYKFGGMNMNSAPLSEVEYYNTRLQEWCLASNTDATDMQSGNLVTEIYNHESYRFGDTTIALVGGVVRDLSAPPLPMIYETHMGSSEVFTGLLYNRLDGYDSILGPWAVVESNNGHTLITYR